MQQFYTAIHSSTLFWLHICCSEIQWVLNVTVYRRFTAVLHDYIFDLWSMHWSSVVSLTHALWQLHDLITWLCCLQGVMLYIYKPLQSLTTCLKTVWYFYNIIALTCVKYLTNLNLCVCCLFQSAQAWFPWACACCMGSTHVDACWGCVLVCPFMCACLAVYHALCAV